MAYEQMIKQYVPGATDKDAEDIEEVMRIERSTLDALTAGEFRDLATDAWEVVQILREEDTMPDGA